MEFKTEKERLIDMIQYAMDIGFFHPDEDMITKINEEERTENQFIMDYATHSHSRQYLDDDVREIYQNINLNTATGEGLDNLGNLKGVARATAQAPQVLVELINDITSAVDIYIPAGTPVELKELESLYGDYITTEDVTIIAGTQTSSVICECTELGVHPALPEDCVIGLTGIPVTAYNSKQGTCGRNIEEDDVYRERIRRGNAIYIASSKSAIENYLNHYPGLDGYVLIPRFDGVGTLKVVCDTLEQNLEGICEGLYANAMDITDEKPVCVLPTNEILQSLVITITKSNIPSNYSDEELKTAIEAQVTTFVEGGTTRTGASYPGMSIGEDFNPSQLVAYLLGEFSECANIELNQTGVITVPFVSRLRIDSVEVIIDGV